MQLIFYQLGARFCLEDLFNLSSLIGVFPHILISSELGCRHHQDLRTERYFPNSGFAFLGIHPWLILSPLHLSQILCSFVVILFFLSWAMSVVLSLSRIAPHNPVAFSKIDIHVLVSMSGMTALTLVLSRDAYTIWFGENPVLALDCTLCAKETSCSIWGQAAWSNLFCASKQRIVCLNDCSTSLLPHHPEDGRRGV